MALAYLSAGVSAMVGSAAERGERRGVRGVTRQRLALALSSCLSGGRRAMPRLIAAVETDAEADVPTQQASEQRSCSATVATEEEVVVVM
jgi:hypothetical protein